MDAQEWVEKTYPFHDEFRTRNMIEAYRAGFSAGRSFAPVAPKFQETFCISCGREFGPGNHGFSHCEDHTPIAAPDLLSLLREVADFVQPFPRSQELLDRIEAAIAKAAA